MQATMSVLDTLKMHAPLIQPGSVEIQASMAIRRALGSNSRKSSSSLGWRSSVSMVLPRRDVLALELTHSIP